jgi:hypothetical protein
MRIALVFYGQPRFLRNPYVYPSHRRHIIDHYETDVFIHTWWSPETSAFDVSSWTGITAAWSDPRTPDILRARYAPAAIEIEAPRKFELSGETRAALERLSNGNPNWGEANYRNLASHLYSVERASELVAASGRQYELIVVTRLDAILDTLPLLSSLRRDRFHVSDHHNHFPDLLYIFGQRFLASQKVYSSMGELAARYADDLWEPSAEALKYASFIDQFSPSDIVPIRTEVGVVRDDTSNPIRRPPLFFWLRQRLRLRQKLGQFANSLRLRRGG